MKLWDYPQMAKISNINPQIQGSTSFQDSGEKGRLLPKVRERMEGKVPSAVDSIGQAWIRPPGRTRAEGKTLCRRLLQFPFPLLEHWEN